METNLRNTEDQIITWLTLEISRMQNCPKNCAERECEDRVKTYLYIRDQIFTGKYKERLIKLSSPADIIEAS